MITLEYECKKIRSPKEMEEIEKYVEEWRERGENFRESLSATYNALVRVLHPGKPEDGCMIVTLEVIAPDLALSEKDGNTFADLAMEALIATGLNKQYILSVRMKESAAETRCLIAFFPMEEKKRVPNADNWLYGRDKSKPATNLQDDIEIKIAGQFKNVTVTREDTAIDDTHGYKPALLNYKPIPYQKEFDTEIIYPTLDVDAHVQTQLPYDVIAKYSDEILRTFTTGTERLYYERSQKPGTEITETMFMRKVEDFLHNKYPDVGPMDTRTILNRIRRAIYGNYILEPLIESEEISDIACLAPDRIRVKVGGKHYTSNLKFLDVADYYRFIQSICIRNNLKAYNGGSEADNCINVFTDSISSKRFILRNNLVLPYVTNGYPELQIRKISRKKRDLSYLVNTAHMLDDTIANYLKSHVQAGDGLMVAGLPAAGKSTLLNAMVGRHGCVVACLQNPKFE